MHWLHTLSPQTLAAYVVTTQSPCHWKQDPQFACKTYLSTGCTPYEVRHILSILGAIAAKGPSVRVRVHGMTDAKPLVVTWYVQQQSLSVSTPLVVSSHSCHGICELYMPVTTSKQSSKAAQPPGSQAVTVTQQAACSCHFLSHLRYRLLPGPLSTQPHGLCTHAMVGIAQCHHIKVAGVCTCEHEGHVIGLTAAVYKVDHLQGEAPDSLDADVCSTCC